MPDLAGRNEAPPLAGGTFMNTWRARSTRDLFDLISATMPPTVAGLSADQYLAIASYILQSNGAAAGTQALTAETSVAIGSIASGVTRTAAGQAGAAGRGAGRQGAGTPAGAAPGGRGITTLNGPTGLTVAGEVKHHTPVTDEMLRTPNPGPSAGRFPTDPFLVNGPTVNRALLDRPATIVAEAGQSQTGRIDALAAGAAVADCEDAEADSHARNDTAIGNRKSEIGAGEREIRNGNGKSAVGRARTGVLSYGSRREPAS